MNVSAFTFLHNGVAGGYPFVEAINIVGIFVDEVVVVDMQSTDETRQVLEKLGVRVIDGKWTPGAAGECLRENHAMHEWCSYDVIWHFEADEVFSDTLARSVAGKILQDGISQLAVYRLQVEQNFQRCRWYPELVHRVFFKGTAQKSGHTTVQHQQDLLNIEVVPPEHGFLWDITNCFRDDWMTRAKQQGELWGEKPRYRFVPYHFTRAPAEAHEDVVSHFLEEPHWTWQRSPFNLPPNLRCLVGATSYREHLHRKGLI